MPYDYGLWDAYFDLPLAAGDYRFSLLVKQIVRSEPFQTQSTSVSSP